MHVDLFNQNKIEALEERIAELEEEIADLSQENSDLKDAIDERDNVVSSIEDRLLCELDNRRKYKYKT